MANNKARLVLIVPHGRWMLDSAAKESGSSWEGFAIENRIAAAGDRRVARNASGNWKLMIDHRPSNSGAQYCAESGQGRRAAGEARWSRFSANNTVGVKTSGLFEVHPVLSYTPT
jgi:hypothetical protein